MSDQPSTSKRNGGATAGGEKQADYNRKERSLSLLAEMFIQLYGDGKTSTICLDQAASQLSVERRRIYDIVNVLESLDIVSREAKNRYSWNGLTRVPAALNSLREEGATSPLVAHFLASRNQLDSAAQMQTNAGSSQQSSAGRKEKSLGLLAQYFLQIFLWAGNSPVCLEECARCMLGPSVESSKIKTKVRRLYDIANILMSLRFIEKTHIDGNSKRPAFRWLGSERELTDDVLAHYGHSVVWFIDFSKMREVERSRESRQPRGQKHDEPSLRSSEREQAPHQVHSAVAAATAPLNSDYPATVEHHAQEHISASTDVQCKTAAKRAAKQNAVVDEAALLRQSPKNKSPRLPSPYMLQAPNGEEDDGAAHPSLPEDNPRSQNQQNVDELTQQVSQEEQEIQENRMYHPRAVSGSTNASATLSNAVYAYGLGADAMPSVTPAPIATPNPAIPTGAVYNFHAPVSSTQIAERATPTAAAGNAYANEELLHIVQQQQPPPDPRSLTEEQNTSCTAAIVHPAPLNAIGRPPSAGRPMSAGSMRFANPQQQLQHSAQTHQQHQQQQQQQMFSGIPQSRSGIPGNTSSTAPSSVSPLQQPPLAAMHAAFNAGSAHAGIPQSTTPRPESALRQSESALAHPGDISKSSHDIMQGTSSPMPTVNSPLPWAHFPSGNTSVPDPPGRSQQEEVDTVKHERDGENVQADDVPAPPLRQPTPQLAAAPTSESNEVQSAGLRIYQRLIQDKSAE